MTFSTSPCKPSHMIIIAYLSSTCLVRSCSSGQITCRCMFRAGRSGPPGPPRVARVHRCSPGAGPRICAYSAPCRTARVLSIAIEAPLCWQRVADPGPAFGRRCERKVQRPAATARSPLRRSRTAVSIASCSRSHRRHGAIAGRALGRFGKRGALGAPLSRAVRCSYFGCGTMRR